MKSPIRRVLSIILLAAMPQWCAAQTKTQFPLKDGDVWVMAGDSITEQHLHSNYFEAFCFARYPNLKFAFRNSGVGGSTIPATLARFDYDIADWKPTVVSVELGMNDQGGATPEKFVANMGIMTGQIRSRKARPVIFSPSPMNNGDTMAKLDGNKRLNDYAVALKSADETNRPSGQSNKRLNDYAVALKEFSAKEDIAYSDQFHALLDVWGNNKPRERLADSLAVIRPLAADNSLVGVEHLREFLRAQDKAPGIPPVSMQGDAVHLGPPGQLMMAAALLKGLGADGFVSSVAIEGDKVGEARGCKVDGLKIEGGKIEFDRLDERSPFPIPDEARGVVALYPAILELSQYTLKVTGLKDGNHILKINDFVTATLTAKELESGVNLTTFGANSQVREVNPIVAQGRAILAAVSNKEGIVSQWRGLGQRAHGAGAPAELKDLLAALAKKVEEADEKIREAAEPRKLHFELSPTP
jgi:lysophospholipase L1-like esterase